MGKTDFINVPVTQEMKAQVKKLAEANDMSEAAIARQALREFLDQFPAKNKKQPQTRAE